MDCAREDPSQVLAGISLRRGEKDLDVRMFAKQTDEFDPGVARRSQHACSDHATSIKNRNRQTDTRSGGQTRMHPMGYAGNPTTQTSVWLRRRARGYGGGIWTMLDGE